MIVLQTFFYLKYTMNNQTVLCYNNSNWSIKVQYKQQLNIRQTQHQKPESLTESCMNKQEVKKC